MMKNLLLIPCLFFQSLQMQAQQGMWAWMNGDSINDQVGIYGTMGAPGIANTPGARYESGSFTDLQNNMWLFGGSGWDYISGVGFLSDLWKYDPATNMWTFVKGDSIKAQSGIYGTQGVPSIANKPGGRYAFITWHHTANFLWMFGGDVMGGLVNDLWRYDLLSNEWTWMKGSSTPGANGVYGTKGVPAAANTPGARNETTCSWVDNNGDLWLFGGYGKAASGGNGSLNDLWKYSVAANEWAWMSGSSSANASGIYGTKGIANPLNVPGARQVYCSWKDQAGNLWLFGGTGNQYFNDLWKYDIVTNEWTWMNGGNTAGGAGGGYYSPQCVADSLNVPPRRLENKAAWTDSCDNLWMYGGFPNLGDLWRYSVSLNEWVWMSGDSVLAATAIHGIKTIASITNKPGSRFGSPSWKLPDGSLWLFGGPDGTGGRGNDMWKFIPDTNCSSCIQSAPIIAFSSSDSSHCEKTCIDFFDLSTSNPTSWQWSFPGADSTSSILQNPINVCYNSYGSFDVTLIACNSIGCDTLTIPNFITIYQSPSPPTIIQSNDSLICSATANSHQWYLNSLPITGATQSTYVPTQQGLYYVIITDSNQCDAASNSILITTVSFIVYGLQFTVMSNPNSGSFTLKFNGQSKKLKLQITNILGKLIYENDFENLNGKFSQQINLNDAAIGIYVLKLMSDEKIFTQKIIVK